MVRSLFQRFLRVGSVTKLVVALRSEGMTTKGGKPIDKGYVTPILRDAKTIAGPRVALNPVAPAAPRYLRKVRRLASGKATQNHALTSSVLISRSPEVWRQSGREKEFQVSARASKCGAFSCEARGYWALARARK